MIDVLSRLHVLVVVGLTMMIFTLCVTGLGLLTSSSSNTRAKWLSCQTGRPSRHSLDNYNTNTTFLKSTSEWTALCSHTLSCCAAGDGRGYLQDQGDACREEGHEDQVVGQDGHAAKTAHYLQLGNTCKTKGLHLYSIHPQHYDHRKVQPGHVQGF